ncbi:MFS general substrate transporter [Lactarius akahatsu]|uniref:MFS general substrate transporter n=1 Tax=Lactarius akahatsu TaxID=416441 RepID=A0AAD4Q589_9AGAM|nr:MFS general substrate transporter [Lactarius akahatsu]
MSLTRFDDHEIDEETPFLPNHEDLNPSQTPLPTAQICILLTTWLADSVLSNSISPYLNQLVRELPEVGGDARKVGYYTGIIVHLTTFSKRVEVNQNARQVSLHYAAIAVTSFQWNRLSDHVGRKPVLLSCLVGTTLSTLLFGLSRSFWALVLSQCLLGAVTGHVGVVSSMTAELTDETNVAQGFSMLPVAWSLGRVIGPLIGGVLSRPQDRWPHVFSHSFWSDYPYFLPCLVAAIFVCLSLVISGFYLEETLDSRPSERLRLASPNSDSPQRGAGDSPDLEMSSNELDKPLPLRSVLTKPVVVTTANYALFAMLSAVAAVYIPLVWSTPVEYGGLNLDPASIGLGLSVYGGMGGFFQFVFFSHFVSRCGLRRVFILSIASCAVIYTLFPFENVVVACGGPNFIVWLLIILQMSSLYSWRVWGYSGAMNIYIPSAAPNRRSLGAVYGLSHVATSVSSAVGQVAADWLFAFSLTHNILGGKFAFIVFLGVVCIELGVSTQLPKNTWAHLEE